MRVTSKRKSLWPFGLVLVLLTVGAAHADVWKVRCTELIAAGVDRVANCGPELQHRTSPPGDPAASTLRVSYELKGPPEEVVWFHLQASRIDLPTNATAVLHVTGLRVERMRLPSQERGFAQGRRAVPARLPASTLRPRRYAATCAGTTRRSVPCVSRS